MLDVNIPCPSHKKKTWKWKEEFTTKLIEQLKSNSLNHKYQFCIYKLNCINSISLWCHTSESTKHNYEVIRIINWYLKWRLLLYCWCYYFNFQMLFSWDGYGIFNLNEWKIPYSIGFFFSNWWWYVESGYVDIRSNTSSIMTIWRRKYIIRHPIVHSASRIGDSCFSTWYYQTSYCSTWGNLSRIEKKIKLKPKWLRKLYLIENVW